MKNLACPAYLETFINIKKNVTMERNYLMQGPKRKAHPQLENNFELK
jgi:hypothetical protein